MDDQVALEALVRMTDEELKHQELFRRIEAMMAADMPPGYVQTADPNAVARLRARQEHLGRAGAHAATSSCSRRRTTARASSRMPAFPSCGRTCSCSTGRRSRSTRSWTSWSWLREDARLTKAERDAAVDDLIALVGGVDGILQAQAKADAAYFVAVTGAGTDAQRAAAIESNVLKAYRWQYIVCGVMEPRFQKVLFALVDRPRLGASRPRSLR